MKVISIVNIAGGVAKTTTAVNFAHALALHGLRILVVDLDPQANSTTYIGTTSRLRMAAALVDPDLFPQVIGPSRVNNVEVAHGSLETAGAELMLAAQPATAALRLRKCLRTIAGRYDFILVDSPPAPGLLTVNAIAAADELLIPVETKPKALEGVGNMRALLAQIVDDPDLMPKGPPPASYLATRYDARTILDRACLEGLRGDSTFPTLETVIRVNQRIPESYAHQKSVIAHDVNSYGAHDYRALAKEYLARV
jgi:chromosome partitioning protein